MILEITCTDSGILAISKVIKNFFYWLQIIGPILAIVALAIFIAKAVTTNDKNEIKKYQKNMTNSLIAMAMLFFLPYLMDISMQLIGNKTSFTSCWNSIDNVKLKFSSNYIKTEQEEKANKEDKTKVYTNPKDYHGKVTTNCLDLTCSSSVVKAQFSCDTLKIVEKHLYDLNAQNFYSVINSYGGFDKYAQSLGGIFGEYYGKTITGRTEKDFQTAAEYVLGWMFMYGWDYASAHEDAGGTSGRHVQWKGKDAFYINGGWKRKYVPDYPGNYLQQPEGTNIDHIISGQNGVGGMASECGDLVTFTYKKLGIKMKVIKKINRLRDLKVGDDIAYSNSSGGGHVNMVGEVYSDHIVLYDGGSYMQGHLNYKRNIYYPKVDSKEADDAAVREAINGMDQWTGRRYYNFGPSTC